MIMIIINLSVLMQVDEVFLCILAIDYLSKNCFIEDNGTKKTFNRILVVTNKYIPIMG